MKRNIKKQSISFKFVLALFSSNLVLFIILTTPSDELSCHQQNKNQEKYLRQGYVSVKVTADLKTEFIPNRPVKITNLHRDFQIQHAFILKELASANENNLFDSTISSKNYLIEVKKNDFAIIAQAKNLQIFSHQANIKVFPRKKNYEIRF